MVALPHGPDLIAAFAHTLPFALDPFQREAIAELSRGHSVLVTAPTGAGKTVVADFAAFAAIATGRTLVYTTPIKALSNQKYRQLVDLYGLESVGLITGDIAVNREATLLVMTTEILRNALIVDQDPLQRIGYVVVDEIHFVADRERGVVWEETLIWCPKHIQLVCLSATVSNADEVAGWLGHIHGRTALVRHDERPVPLEDYVFHAGDLHLIRDITGRRARTFPRLGTGHGRRRRRDDPELPAAVVRRLRERTLLPAIYFRFGRRSAEEVAWSIAQAAVLFPADPGHAAAIAEAVERTLATIDEDTRGLDQVTDLTDLLPTGVAYHHAGLIHPLKVLVETLFAAGHLQVVVATSTLAMGLHLPARSVVIGALTKFNGVDFEPLTATEYRQMTGRAGRRGLDTLGVAVLVPSAYLPFEAAYHRMSGEPEPLRSAFELRYNTVLNIYRPEEEERILALLENNLAHYQQLRAAGGRGRRRKGAGLREGLQAMLAILKSERLLTHQGQLTRKGQVARHIFNPWELAVTALLLSDTLGLLEPAELAEVMSLLIPSKFGPAAPPSTGPESRQRRDHERACSPRDHAVDLIARTVERLRRSEERHGIALTPEWEPPDHRFVRAWCVHGHLSETVEAFDVSAGDGLQLLGQTLDLLQHGERALTRIGRSGAARARLLRRAIDALSHDGKLERLLGLG